MRHALLLAVALAACGGGSSSTSPPATPATPTTPAAGGACIKAGCSGSVCQDASAEQLMTTCEMRPEYACYQSASCERQADGQCGWTPTPELSACLASPPAL